MRHRKVTKTLDRKAGPRRALLSGLAQSVLLYEKVQTTSARAKAVRPLVEKLVELGKSGTLSDRRALLSVLSSPLAVKKMLEVIGPRYAKRTGGYVRILRTGPRQGDGASMVQMELV